MSGDVLNPELRDFATGRGIHLLAKPFDIDSIERTVADLLGQAHGAPAAGQPAASRPDRSG
jgi:hypothetical protein